MKRITFLVTALVLVLGLTQCKKDQEKPQSKTVNITLEVKGGGNSAKVDVNPNGSPMVTFESGDQILVGYDGKYVGTLTHNGTRFAGTIEVTQNGDQPLYFYFVGNKNKSGAAISVGDATYSVDISDQSAELPVLSFSASNEDFNGAGTYTASLHNQCTLVELTLTSGTTAAVGIGDRYTQATINFGGTPGIVPNTETTGMITTKSESDTKKYAILLPQAAAAGVHIAIGSVGYTLDLPAMNAGKYVQFNDEGAAASNIVYLDYLTTNYEAANGQTLTGTLGANVKISIADGATVTLDGVTINGVNNSSYPWAGINCVGTATIILKDGTTNTVSGFYEFYPGIHVLKNYTLTIQGTGTLNASSSYGAGIGGGAGINCGNIQIESGTINVDSHIGTAAGIGGGRDASCGNITISGGLVTAIGGAAGIGSGYAYSKTTSCGNISITGGTIIATGGSYCAGIGSGCNSNCGAITITSGVTSVTATKGSDAYNSIGKGWGNSASSCGTVTIGGVVYWNGSSYQNGGDTYLPTSPLVYPTPAPSMTDLATITENYTASDGEILTGTLGANVKISIADGATVTLDGVSINASGTWTTGNYAGITCAGDATITLEGTNTVKGFDEDYPGIQAAAGKTLIINGSGTLTASTNNGDGGAGIGAGRQIHCGNIEIQNGTIIANGGQYGAGIGGGFLANCGNITISGGTVMATGGYRAAGIGGGTRSGSTAGGNCGNITISGGTVTATGGESAAGIGGGRGNNINYKSSCGTITIANTVTKVTATMGDGSTNSIGAGKYCNCGTVTIGGVVGAITTSPYTYQP